MRIINFAPFNSHTNNMFLDNKLLNIDDISKVKQLKQVFNFKIKNLPIDLLDLLKLNSEKIPISLIKFPYLHPSNKNNKFWN